ncbi:MAG: hypothetical protein ACT4PO_02610 [Actinomycetota bacterium]
MKPTVRERVAGWRLRRRIRKGKAVWGRQRGLGDITTGEGMDIPMHGHVTIEAVITRADGAVEDLGVISEGDV